MHHVFDIGKFTQSVHGQGGEFGFEARIGFKVIALDNLARPDGSGHQAVDPDPRRQFESHAFGQDNDSRFRRAEVGAVPAADGPGGGAKVNDHAFTIRIVKHELLAADEVSF